MTMPDGGDSLAPAAPPRAPTVGIVTVTHNSGRFFRRYMQSLAAQTVMPALVVLVDSGSSDTAFLNTAAAYSVPTRILLEQNVGFSLGNNIGWSHLRQFDYTLFLNPDAFLEPDFLERAVRYMEEHSDVGMLTPTLIRYDIEQDRPKDIVDGTGVVRSHLGVTVERDAGQPVTVLERYTGPNEVPWLCAAVALSRREALESVVEHEDQVFDNSFFMYKEDTDLAWRVRRAGWKLIHLPSLVSYHCRGWQSRKSISRTFRLLSTRNEMRMCIKNRSPFVVIAAAKYLLVRLFDL